MSPNLGRKLRLAFTSVTSRLLSRQKSQASTHRLITKYLLLALIATVALLPAFAQTNVFSCSSFSASGACGAVQAGYGNESFIIRNGGYISGNKIDFVPANSGHNGYGLWYHVPVNVQEFATSFNFVPNGQNIAFVIQNTTNNPGYQGNIFASGAGCEAGFYQDFVQGENYPNNLFALEFDSGSWLTNASEAFTYSGVQIYQSNQSPCLPNDNGPNWVPISKISTYPVPLNSPVNAQYKTTGHLYSAKVTYDGTNLSLSMYDVTAGGSCPGATCFTHSWPVNIPSLVGSPTALVGFTAGINIPNLPALYVDSWSYTADGTTTSPPPAEQTSTPIFSPASGTYSSPQSVTISDATSGAAIYYTTNGSTPTTASSRYGGPVTVGSTETLQAMALAGGDTDSAVASASYTVTSSSGSGSSGTPVINYPNGFSADPSSLWLGGSSAYSGSSIQLTNANLYLANDVWFKTPVNVQDFTTTFTWTASCPAKPSQCGDGMGFMIIGTSNGSSAGYNYSGYSGDNLAWSRCGANCPSLKSILVKFDLYNNQTYTDGANLTGFYTNGVLPQPPQAEYNMASSGINIQSGHLMKATLSYNGSVLTEAVTDTVSGATYRNSYSANIPSLVGGDTAYVGFGGSSGGALVTQDLKSWTYTVE